MRCRSGAVRRRLLAALVLGAMSQSVSLAADATFVSHRPMRPLPAPSSRPIPEGPVYFVDAVKGEDAADGSLKAPWKSINASLAKLKPGDTLLLRGGTYYETVTIRLKGTAAAPITLRAYPDELVVIDAGLREFFENPANAWEPVPDGAADEYRSKNSYPDGGGFGNFADSMIPFQRYITLSDLRSTNELVSAKLGNRVDDPVGIYAGPGVRRDEATGRIHIRLAHTRLEGLGSNGYAGETDPRKMALVIAGKDEALSIAGAEHIRVQDLVLRGASRQALKMEKSSQIDLEGLTLYGCLAAIRMGEVEGLRMTHCALRGHAAPWHSRFHHKDRSKAGYLFFGSGKDIEIANCELTDHHDGISIQNLQRVRFHHNYFENFNDDGIEPGPRSVDMDAQVYCNYLSQSLATFTAHGKKPTPVEAKPGSGVYVYRNVVDTRKGVYIEPPFKPDPTGAFYAKPVDMVLSDHQNPIQQNYYVYHNTFLTPQTAWRDSYAFGWGVRTAQTTRRVFNNICVQTDGLPGMKISATPGDDFEADGNLFWSVRKGPDYKGDLFATVRGSELVRESRKTYPAGILTHDVFADPKFARLSATPGESQDLTPAPDSAAINGGVSVPESWPDPLRAVDAGKPDIGAVPGGATLWRVGVRGRYNAFGELAGK